MYFFGLVWTETCNFGSAILVGSALIVLAYFAWVFNEFQKLFFKIISTGLIMDSIPLNLTINILAISFGLCAMIQW